MSWLSQLLSAFGPWHWWVAGLLLAILEIFAPGVAFIWMGLAAGGVGVIVFVFPGLDWRLQFVVFAILSVASVVVSRRFLKKHPIETDRPDLNRRGQQYIGDVYTLAEPIVDGRGRLKVHDTMWKILGPDLPAGNHIRITGVDGVMLTVEPAEAPKAEAKEA